MPSLLSDDFFFKISYSKKKSFSSQGSYRQVSVKFKDFSRTSKRLSYCFHGLKTYEKY